MTDIVIVGAGCAGLTAAVYAAREGRSALVLESGSVGGQISYSPRVENYPGIKEISGMEFADALYEQAESFGAELDLAEVKGIEKTADGFAVATDSGERECRAVILATGAKHRELGLPRERELTGRGVSYCALCDGAFYMGEDVAVVGGGSSALQSAETLAGICRSVALIHRRGEFRGENALAERLGKKDNVRFILDSEVSSLNGGETLEGITAKNKLTGEEQTLGVKCLFVTVGQQPDNARFAELVKLDDYGYIDAGEDCKTSCEGIFAAGDCRAKQVRQLATAAADGAVAATAACGYLKNL